jgi:hypothetical protein
VLSHARIRRLRLLRPGNERASASDRRAHLRRLCALEGTCRVGPHFGPHFSSWWPATVLDLSAGGALVALWGWGKPEEDISIRLIKDGRSIVEMNASVQHMVRYEDVWLFGCAFERDLRDAEIHYLAD